VGAAAIELLRVFLATSKRKTPPHQLMTTGFRPPWSVRGAKTMGGRRDNAPRQPVFRQSRSGGAPIRTRGSARQTRVWEEVAWASHSHYSAPPGPRQAGLFMPCLPRSPNA
jgi:hypothetical protein